MLPLSVLNEILAHVRREYPVEACGVLLGRVREGTALVVRSVPLTNILASSSAFWFDVREWMATVMSGRRGGLSYIGIYHSHAREQPLPSLADRHRMLECPGEVWLLVAYLPSGEPRLAAFKVDEYGLARVDVRVES